MASNKPVLHGRDHLPGGPDPIPILATILGVEFVYLTSNGSITLPDDNSEVAFDWQGGVSSAGADALTENPEVFDLNPIVGGPFDGKHGLRIKEVGPYLAFSEIRTVSPDESALYTPATQHMGYETQGTGVLSQSDFIFSGNFDQAEFGVQAVCELWAIGSDALGDFGGLTILLTAQNDRGTGDVDVRGHLVVVRLGKRDMAELPVLL